MAEEHPVFEYWRKSLNGARYVVAPMVDASELAWRMLSRRYGAELCYTPMLHSNVFVKDARYRKDNLESCSEDRPLIVQFCANDPEVFAKACSLAAPFCDGIDLNLGCPQAIAKKGHYGAFLMEEWTLISDMIKLATKRVDKPISAKIRIFPEIEETIRFARMLESAGISLLTVHGRTRDQKGALTGIASWEHIKAVRDALKIPIFANGNIQYLEDVDRCLKATGAQGVMSAEGNLHNPALFTGTSPPVWDMALEYLELAKKYPCPLSYSRGHIFKLMHHVFNMPENFEFRHRMSKASSFDAMIKITMDLRDSLFDFYNGTKSWVPEDGSSTKLPLPPWLCQPYVRISAEEHLIKLAESQQKALERQRNLGDALSKRRDASKETEELSIKKKKKLERNPNKKFQPTEAYDKCLCKNPRGNRCSYFLCRTCCRFKCHVENLECPGHRIRNKPKREENSNSSVQTHHETITESESQTTNENIPQNNVSETDQDKTIENEAKEKPSLSIKSIPPVKYVL